jgi:predicted dehydrogenase
MSAANPDSDHINRRDFLAKATAVGVGAVLGGTLHSALGAPAGAGGDLNVGIIGVGSQGMILLRDALRIPGIRFGAICDIWPYRQRYASGIIRKSRQPRPKVYEDYREMLSSESDLDAVIVATPDWMHADHTVAALQAGLHVYCEKEMSNSLEGARQIVQAARTSGKVVQIGHQRRSNPGYLHARQLIEKDKALGRITTCYGQWNRAASEKATVPDKLKIQTDVLKRYGYDTMDRFQNWRWYRKFSGGPIADLGSHQVDVFNWFLHAAPTSVVARGGQDYYSDGREWYDGIMAIYEYLTPAGPVRAFYQVLNTTSYGSYYETFMGDRGTINISEDPTKGFYVPEPTKKPPEWVNEADRVEKMGASAIKLIGESRKEAEKKKEKMEPQVKKAIHQLHLENFFDAIRKGTPVSCPPEIGYETAVTVLRVNDAVVNGQPMEFAPTDFKV